MVYKSVFTDNAFDERARICFLSAIENRDVEMRLIGLGKSCSDFIIVFIDLLLKTLLDWTNGSIILLQYDQNLIKTREIY